MKTFNALPGFASHRADAQRTVLRQLSLPFSGSLLLAMLISLCGPTSLWAQSNGPEKPTGPLDVVDAEAEIEGRYDRIYVPNSGLGELLSVRSGMLVEKAQFFELLDQARAQQDAQAGQPAGIIIKQVQYEATIQGDVLAVTAVCDLEKYEAGWAQLPIPLSNVTLKSATLAGEPAPIGLIDGPVPIVLLDRFVGTRELILKLTTPIERSGTDQLASFAVFNQQQATLNMQLPAGRVLQINGVTVEASDSQGQARQISRPVGGLRSIQLRLTDSVGESLEESLVFANTEYGIDVAQKSVSWQAKSVLKLFGKRFNELQFSVPNSLEMTDVQASGLQAWELRDDPERANWTRIVLTFRETIPEQITVTLSGVQLIEAESSWRIARLELLGATAHTGGLAIAAPPQIRLKTELLEGIRPATRNWTPSAESLKNKPVRYYDIWEEDFVFELSQAVTENETQAAVSHVLSVGEIDVRLTSVITMQTLFSPLFDVTMEIPEQWQPEQITIEGTELNWQIISNQAGVNRIRIELTPPLKSGQQRTIRTQFKWIGETGTFDSKPQQFVLPEPNIDGISILEGTYTIVSDPLLDIVPSQIVGMDPAFIGLPGERFGYRYQDSKIGGQIAIIRKPARTNTTTMQIVSIQDDQVSVTLNAILNVSGGGIRQVEVELSDVPELEAEFTSKGSALLSEQKRTQTETGMRWRLTFDRFVTGAIPLSVQFTIPTPATETFSVPELVWAQAELQEQYIAFVAQPDQRITVEVADRAGLILEPLDPAELPFSSQQPDGRVVAGYHLIRPGLQAEVQVETFDAAAIPTAIGQKLELSSIVLESGSYQQQAKLTFAAIGVQSLLIELPDQSRLWSTTIDGQPVTAREGTGGFLVSLSGLNRSAQSHELQLIYGLNAASLNLRSFGSTTLPAPQFAVLDGLGEQQNLTIMQTVWQVHHGSESQISPLDVSVEQITQSDQHSWLRRLTTQIGKQSWSGSVVNLLFGTLVSGIAGMLTWLVVRGILPVFSVSKKRSTWSWFVIPLIAIALCGLCSLMLVPGIQSAREAAVRTDQAFEPESGYVTGDSIPDMSAEAADSEGLSFEMQLGEQAPEYPNSVATPAVPGKPTRAPAFTAPQAEAKTQQSIAGMNSPDSFRLNETSPEPSQQLGSGNRQYTPPTQLRRHTIQNNTNFDVGQPVDRFQSDVTHSQTLNMPEPVQDLEYAEPFPAAQAQPRMPQADGLLSLQLTMQIPDHLQTTRFRSTSLTEDGVRVRYYSQTALNRLRWMIAAGCVLLFWLFRRASRTVKFSLAVSVIGSTIAALGAIPLVLLPILDGLLLGGGIGLLIWAARASGAFVRRMTHKFWSTRAIARTVATVWLIGSCLTITQLRADEKPVAPPAESKKIPLIFPYDLDDSPLAASRVFVPKQEYMRLWQLAHPNDTPTPAPVATQIHEASYVAQFKPADDSGDEPVIQLRARYVIRNYRSEPQSVALPIRGMIVESVSVNEKPIATTVDGKRQPVVILPTEGLFIVDAQLRLPADVFGAAGQFDVEFLPAVSGALSFALPEKQVDVSINAGQVPFQLVDQNNTTYAEVGIAKGGKYTIAWQPKVAGGKLQFLSCDSAREIQIHDHGADLQYVFKLQIAQGSFSDVEFELPEGVKLKALSGTDLAGWQLLDDSRLRVLFKSPIEDQTVVTVLLYRPLNNSDQTMTLNLPDVVPQGISREIGSWAIGWDASLNVQFENMEQLRQLRNEQYNRIGDSALVTQLQRVYRFTGRPHGLTLKIDQKQATARVQHHTLVDVQPHKTHMATVAKIELLGEPRLSITFQIPKQFQIVDLTATSLDDWFISQTNDSPFDLLTVTFSQPQQGSVEVIINGNVQQSTLDTAELELQIPQMTDVERNANFLGVGATDLLSLSLMARSDWQTIDPTRLPGVLKSMANFPIRIGLQNRSLNSESVRLGLQRQRAQMKANSVTVVAVSAASIDYGLSLEWTTTRAASDNFRFRGPAWMKDRIEFQSDQIRQVSTQPVDERTLIWTISTKSAISQKFFLTAVVSVPQPADRTVTIPVVTFLNSQLDTAANSADPLQNQAHYAVLVNLGLETLEPISNHVGQLVQAQELPIDIPAQMRKQAMEVVQVTENVVPSWELKPVALAQSAPATVPLARLTTAIDGGGNWRTVAVYEVRNRQRQFLPVVLPAESALLSVLVNDEPSRAVAHRIGEQAVSLVPLPPAGAADLSIKVRLVIEGRLPAPLLPRWSFQRISLPAPHIVTSADSPDFGIPVLHTVWTLSTPEEAVIRELSGAGTNLSLTDRREVTRIDVQNRLQEIAALSRIVDVSSYSIEKRQRAADNLKQLKSDLSSQLSDQRESLNDEALKTKQAEIFSEAEDNLNRFDQSQTQSRGAMQQSLGRSYIIDNNFDILRSNGGVILEGVPQSPENQTVSAKPERIRLPQAKPESQKSSRDEKAATKSLPKKSESRQQNRKRLLEENLLQNSVQFEQAPALQQLAEPIVPQIQDELQIVPRNSLNSPFDLPNMNGAAGLRSQVFTNEQDSPFDANSDGVVTFTADPGRTVLAQATESWTATGGLSLPIFVPDYDQTLVFSKVGGQPELRIEVYSRSVWNQVWGLGWLVLSGGLVLWFVTQAAAIVAGRRNQTVGLLTLIGGLLGFAWLPAGLAWLGLMIAVCGGIFYAAAKGQRTNVTKQAV